jgi:hypothetical protein
MVVVAKTFDCWTIENKPALEKQAQVLYNPGKQQRKMNAAKETNIIRRLYL